MKKINKIFSGIMTITLVCLMVLSAMPAGIAFAAGDADGVWQEIAKLNFYSGDDNKDTTADVSNTKYVFKKTIDNGQTVVCEGNAGTGGSINIGAWRDDKSTVTSEGDIAPAELSNKVLVLTRKYASNSARMRPTSYLQISDLFNTSTLKKGDKIRVNAWVNTNNIIYRFDPSTNKSEQVTTEDPVGVRMWLGETMGSEGIATTMMPLKWKKLSFEYVVTDDNKDIDTIRIDNSSSETTVYPHKTYLGAVTVEKFLSNNETLATVDFASFTTTTAASETGSTPYEGTVTSSQGVTYNATVPKGGWYRVAKGNTFVEPSANSAVVTGTSAVGGKYLFQIDRRYTGNSGAKYPPNSMGLNISGNFGEINTGDKIRVTAYLGTRDVKVYNGTQSTTPPGEISDQENATSVIHMSLKDANDAIISETTDENFPNKQWSTVVCEYTATEDQDLDKIVIDAGSANGTNYAQRTFISGITVEKINKIEGTYEIADGTVSGDVFAGVVPGENLKVIVAAYAGKNFVGADVQDYTLGTNEYTFSIENAADADQVVCFVWNMETLYPYIDAIPLKPSK